MTLYKWVLFYFFWSLCSIFLLTIEATVWPFLFGQLSAPQLALNSVIAISFLLHKPYRGPHFFVWIWVAPFSALGYGYWLFLGALVYTALTLIRSNTFLVRKKSLIFILAAFHLVFYISQEIFYSYWYQQPFQLSLSDLALTVVLSVATYPVLRRVLEFITARFPFPTWGEIIYE